MIKETKQQIDCIQKGEREKDTPAAAAAISAKRTSRAEKGQGKEMPFWNRDMYVPGERKSRALGDAPRLPTNRRGPLDQPPPPPPQGILGPCAPPRSPPERRSQPGEARAAAATRWSLPSMRSPALQQPRKKNLLFQPRRPGRKRARGKVAPLPPPPPPGALLHLTWPAAPPGLAWRPRQRAPGYDAGSCAQRGAPRARASPLARPGTCLPFRFPPPLRFTSLACQRHGLGDSSAASVTIPPPGRRTAPSGAEPRPPPSFPPPLCTARRELLPSPCALAPAASRLGALSCGSVPPRAAACFLLLFVLTHSGLARSLQPGDIPACFLCSF